MYVWDLEFYPLPGERDSPYDYILELSDVDEQGLISHRLVYMQEHDIGEWPQKWFHKIHDKIYQLTAGKTRLMYCIDQQTIVVLHACKKVGQKTRKKDIQRAEIHYQEYMSQKRG